MQDTTRSLEVEEVNPHGIIFANYFVQNVAIEACWAANVLP